MRRTVGGRVVAGVGVDPATRCVHYHTDRDVVAIRFRCCEAFSPCFRCHGAVADHDPRRWPADRFGARAVLCGACGTTTSVRAYLDAGDACPACGAAFNPGCRRHRHLYFDVEGAEGSGTDRGDGVHDDGGRSSPGGR